MSATTKITSNSSGWCAALICLWIMLIIFHLGGLPKKPERISLRALLLQSSGLSFACILNSRCIKSYTSVVDVEEATGLYLVNLIMQLAFMEAESKTWLWYHRKDATLRSMEPCRSHTVQEQFIHACLLASTLTHHALCVWNDVFLLISINSASLISTLYSITSESQH